MTTRYYKYLETFDTRILTGQFGAKARLCRCGKWPQSPADFFIFFLSGWRRCGYFTVQMIDVDLIVSYEGDTSEIHTDCKHQTTAWPPIDLRFFLTSTYFNQILVWQVWLVGTCWTQILKLAHDFIEEGALKAAGGGRRSFSFWASRANSRHLPSMTIPSNMRFLGASTTARFFGPKRTCSSVSS
jgi:hypothetical protein